MCVNGVAEVWCSKGTDKYYEIKMKLMLYKWKLNSNDSNIIKFNLASDHPFLSKSAIIKEFAECGFAIWADIVW